MYNMDIAGAVIIGAIILVSILGGFEETRLWLWELAK